MLKRLRTLLSENWEKDMVNTERKCCHIDCAKNAEFEIQTINGGPDLYSDTTDSCETHVGWLLGWQPDAPNPEKVYWNVYSL